MEHRSNESEAGIEHLRDLQQHSFVSGEELRKQLARQLNDSAIQSLLAIGIRLAVLNEEAHLWKGEPLSDELVALEELVRELATAARQLRPLELDALGLHSALFELAKEQQGWAPPTIHYAGNEIANLSSIATIGFYRFAQLTLDNVREHAQATAVSITLQTDGKLNRLKIRVNGGGQTGQADWIGASSLESKSQLALGVVFDNLGGAISCAACEKGGALFCAELPVDA